MSIIPESRVQQLVDAIKTLYCEKNNTLNQTKIVAKEYSSNPTFQDPLVVVHGKDNLSVQFRSLAYIFHSVDYQVESHRVVENPEQLEVGSAPNSTISGSSDSTATATGSSSTNSNYAVTEIRPTLIIENKQFYKLRQDSNPIAIEGTTKLQLKKEDDEWVVDKHQDTWKNNNMFERIPAYQWLGRPTFGAVSSFILKLFI